MPFPDVSGAFTALTSQLIHQAVTKTTSGYEVAETLSQPVAFHGVIQTQTPKMLMIKPEGQRDWKWYTLWTKRPLELDDIVTDKAGLKYRVMKKSEWRPASHYEYELTEMPS